MEQVIELRDTRKVFRKFPGKHKIIAVNNINLTIYKGEIYGLLGPNGSGKTTTLKMLLGMLRPTSGKLSILGKMPGSLKVRKKVGFLPEASYLYEFLTGKETLSYYGSLANVSSKVLKERIPEVLSVVGLSDAAKRYVKEYSKGMSRRLQLAQVLIKDPDIYFLDEPTIGLDPIGSKEMKNVIIELRNKGKTVILSSHLLSEVETVCDRIGILYNGNMISEGNLNELLESTDEYEVVMRDLNEARKKVLKDFLLKNDIQICREGHPQRRLDELFVEEVEKKKNEKD